VVGLGVELAEVDLHEAITVVAKDVASDPKRRIDLSCVAQVQAQRSVGQLGEVALKLEASPTARLPLVHVLKEEKAGEVAPASVVADRIGMKDDRPSALDARQEHPRHLVLAHGAEPTWRVDRDVVELPDVQAREGRHEVGKLMLPQSRELNRCTPMRAEQVEPGLEVASCESAGGKADRVHQKTP
jgi:hypothetical protein